MKKVNIKYLSAKFKALVLAGAITLAGGLSGCEFDKTKQDNTTETATSTDAITEITTEEEVEKTVDYQKYYQEINNASEDVINFINDNLAKGTYSFEVTEEMKESMAKTYLDYYLMMNKNQLSGVSFDILNQDNDMIALDMMNSSMVSEQFIQEQAIISESGVVLDYSKLIKSDVDKEFIQNLANIVASMHTAIKNDDKESLDNLANQVIEIKNGLMSDNAEYSMIYEPMTIDLAIMLIDSADMLYNGMIITDDEDLAQIFNTSFVKCIDGDYVTSMTDERLIALADELKVEGYQSMTREEILETISNLHYENVSEVSIRSSERSIAKALMSEVLANTRQGEYSEDYSYKAIIKYISEHIDLSLQVIPEQSYLDVLNNNPYGSNVYKEDQTSYIGFSTTFEVPANEVPADKKQPSTEESVTYETDNNGNVVEKKTNDTYLKAKTNGITDGSSAAAAAYQSSYAGHATDMPAKSVGSAPSLDCKDYNTVYNYFYNSEWNNSRSSFISMEEKSRKENEQAQPTFVPTENGTEEVIEEKTIDVVEPTKPQDNNSTTNTSTPSQNNSNESDTQFVPVEDGEETIIEEEVITISELKELRNRIIEAYATAYVDNYYNLENNAKRM